MWVALAVPCAATAQDVQEDVRAAQRALQARGYDVGFIDGIMGPRTKAALEEFQRKSALAVTGIVDAPTLRALTSVDAKSPATSLPPAVQPPVVQPSAQSPPPYDYPPARSSQPSPPTASPVPAPLHAPSTLPATGNGGTIGWIIGLGFLIGGIVLWCRRDKTSPSSTSYSTSTSAPPRSDDRISTRSPTRASPLARGSESVSIRVSPPLRNDSGVSPPPSAQAGTAFEIEDGVVIATSARPASQPPPPSFSIPTPPSPKEQSDRCWVGAGRSLTIAGYELRGGLLYVGKELRRHDSAGVENCLINPSLSVVDPTGTTPEVPYYPSYSALEARARGGYLQWLASGRSHPDADIGYVFLYFYGLERRLMLDQAMDEYGVLVAEVERLHRIYHKNYSVNRYARLLLDAARLMRSDRRSYDDDVPIGQQDYELPFSVRLAVGQLLAEGKPIPWSWMYAWTWNDPQTNLRTVHRRADKELKELFRIRFSEKYPDGFRLNAPKARLRWTYRAASGSFLVDLESRLGNLPDVANLTSPTNKMRVILDACAEELEGYSRFLGRRPDGRGTLQALSLLPPELVHTSEGAEVTKFREWLDAQLANGPALVDGSELVTHLAAGASYGKTSIRVCIEMLRSFNVAVMPNPRVSLQLPKVGQPFVLYRCEDEEIPESEVPAFRLASLALTFGAFVAHSDSALSPEEGRQLASLADSAPGLSERGRLDLGAHLRWLQAVPAEPGALRSKLSAVSAEDRHRLGLVALSAASADLSVHPEEIKALQRIYKVLGLNEDTVLSDLHSVMATPAPERLTAIPIAPVMAPGYSFPAKPGRGPAAGDIRLDPERLKHIGESTRRVSEVLSRVFTEEDEAAIEVRLPSEAEDVSAVSVPDTEQLTTFEDLDARFKSFLAELITRPAWSRSELDQLARSHELMTDGALEAINEWAFDHHGDALVEDGDPATIHQYIIGHASTVENVQSQPHQAP
ncbi:TerB N-terminal domain-containing protein [Reyranella sp.]|uniref:TerB N-terminal domain-containing protein n=1 Tax=Reyranella sp. TaxID=1929291 RepID=UPI00378513F3